jgi:hypothetical protein
MTERTVEIIKLLSNIFNTHVDLKTFSFTDTNKKQIIPSRSIILDFNEISSIKDNDHFYNVKTKQFAVGSAVHMKDGKNHYVTTPPQELNSKITAIKAENEAKLRSLGIRFII